ncbi:hypothetical protein LX69_01693 [Breznakibacter xylanolyticus]|uniref:Uncharacterized protein n=1 Tax=Breznakibacter xylanolyticus TaxID=990 RepID=A0A2W7Q597_9BACT|nr:hypothetical protein [Breznakibacter xylanolyticus]PZX16879.1 hypothetical protein LX69_01693 [Breznakibacter xylanolyticus]
MKNFGDYVYIIVMIIAIVASIIKQNKKKAQAGIPPTPRPDDDEAPTYADWFNDTEEEDEEPKPQATPQPAPTPSNTPRSFVRADYFTYDSPDQARPERATPSKALEVEEAQEGRLAVDKNIDIRQAVIYAEILRRPEF